MSTTKQDAECERVLKANRTDFYDILGVDPKTNMIGIRGRYRELALLIHPDRFSGSDEAFKLVQGAYDILKDEATRARYDSRAPPPKASSRAPPPKASSRRKRPAGGARSKQKNTKRRKTRSFHALMELRLEELQDLVWSAVHNREPTAKIPRTVTKCIGVLEEQYSNSLLNLFTGGAQSTAKQFVEAVECGAASQWKRVSDQLAGENTLQQKPKHQHLKDLICKLEVGPLEVLFHHMHGIRCTMQKDHRNLYDKLGQFVHHPTKDQKLYQVLRGLSIALGRGYALSKEELILYILGWWGIDSRVPIPPTLPQGGMLGIYSSLEDRLWGTPVPPPTTQNATAGSMNEGIDDLIDLIDMDSFIDVDLTL